MSRRGLARHDARRDGNESEIRKRFAHHGWHTEQLSGKGIPDLLCWPPEYGPPLRWPLQSTFFVDVKMPKGTLKPAQEKKWAELHAKGIPVYIARTEADVDAIVAGSAEPWRPQERKRPLLPSERVSKALRASSPAVLAIVAADAGKRLRVVREPGTGQKRAPKVAIHSSAFYPPHSKPVDAARAAEETFAPAEPSAWVPRFGGPFTQPPCSASSPCGHCVGCLGSIPG